MLVSVNGWLRINAIRAAVFRFANSYYIAAARRLGGSAAVVPLSRRLDGGPRTRLEAEDALALAHFQGKNNLLVDLTPSNALTLVTMRIVSAAGANHLRQ